MAEREVVVKVRLEDRSAVERLGRLESETKAYQRELRLLNAEIAANGKATRDQAIRVGELTSRIRANQGVTRELKNDLSGLTAAGLRFRDKMAGATTEALAGFGVTAVTVTGAIVALRQAVVGSLEAFAAQEKAEAQLRFAAGDAADALIAQAAALQRVSTTGDEVIIQQQAFLASLGFTEDKIRDIIPAALDLAAATGKDLEFAVRNLAKTYSGLTGELGELIPELKNFSKEELQAGAATEYATKQFAGQAETLRGTYAGSIEAMNNALGDLAESFGGLLAPSIASAAKALADFFSGINAGRAARLEFEGDLTRAKAVFSAFNEEWRKSGLVTRQTPLVDNEQTRRELDAIRARAEAIGRYFDDTSKRTTALEKLERKRNEAIAQRDARAAALASLELALANEALASEEKRAKATAQAQKVTEAATEAKKDDAKATEKQAEAVRVLTDELRAFMKAQQDIEQGVGIGRLDIVGGLQAPQTATEQGVQPMPGSGIANDLQDNLDRTDELTAQYANLFLDLSTSIGQSLGTMFQDVEDTNQKVIMSILETVKTGIRLWLSLTLAREVGTKSFAGIATAAVLTTLVEATFAAAQSAIQGFNTGGVIKGGTPIRRANGDNVLITARVGEVILNEEQQRRLFAMLGPGAFNALGVPGFATGGTITRGTALVNQAAPRPEVIASAENAAFYRTFELRPEVAVKEIIKVSNRVKVIEANNSL